MFVRRRSMLLIFTTKPKKNKCFSKAIFDSIVFFRISDLLAFYFSPPFRDVDCMLPLKKQEKSPHSHKQQKKLTNQFFN